MSLVTNIARSSHRIMYFSSCISWKTIQPKLQSLKTSRHAPGFFQAIRKFNDDPKFKAFKAKQAKMQCDDGYPVHLKGGLIDKILYHATVGGCVIGVAQSIWVLYILATTT